MKQKIITKKINSLHNDILRLKISKDINKKVPNIKYQKLLNLIRNHLFYIPFNKINIILFEDIIKFDNVLIVNTPNFELLINNNNQMYFKTIQVSSMKIDNNLFINKIKNNQNELFYIYTAIDGHYRFTQIEDKNYKKKTRKEKLKNINIF